MLVWSSNVPLVELPSLHDRRAVRPVFTIPAVPIQEDEVRVPRLTHHFLHTIEPLDSCASAAEFEGIQSTNAIR